MAEKTNLTIRIDKEVLKKAKELELNLSATTEGFLKVASLSKEKKIIKTTDLRNEYRKIFLDLIILLRLWGITYLKIGADIDQEGLNHEYYLNPERGEIEHCIDEMDHTIKIWKLNDEWPIVQILSTEEIIKNLVNKIYNTAKENKKRLEDIEILKKILKELNPKEGNLNR